MHSQNELTPEQWRQKAKALREIAYLTRNAQYRRELLLAAAETEILATELGDTKIDRSFDC
jgi:hypothetical protein